MALVLLMGTLAACTGSGGGAALQPPPEIVPAAILGDSWQAQVASGGTLDALAAREGWRSRYGWDLPAAAAAFAAEGDRAALARIHAELAAMYRQAALIQAHAVVQTYKPDQRREGDPAEVEYLLGVSYVILGDLESARAHLGRSGASAVPGLAEADRAWAALVAADDFSLTLLHNPALYPQPEVAPGTVPQPPALPHFSLPETVGELSVETADPTATLQLAMWHRAAAEAADPEVASVLAPWTLALEPPVALADPGLEGLFLGAWPTAADLRWAAALGDPPPGSVFGAALSSCEAGTPDLYCVQEAGSGLFKQLQATMESAAGASGDHRDLARRAQYGLLRLASRLAFAGGDVEGGARLMIEAIDLVGGAEADPLFLLKVAAWDTERRNTLRAQELLHGQASRLPGLDAARVSLDALAIRVSRDAGPAVPLH